jgi:hypothetical protein
MDYFAKHWLGLAVLAALVATGAAAYGQHYQRAMLPAACFWIFAFAWMFRLVVRTYRVFLR